MNRSGQDAPRDWRGRLPVGVRPYLEPAPLAAAFLGISSGFAFAMIAATLTTRLAQYGVRKSAVTAFALTFLAYNFKFLWAPLVDTVRIAGAGPLRAAAVVAVVCRAAGDGRGRLPGHPIRLGAAAGGRRRHPRGRRRRDLRHRHRRLPHRVAGAAAARRRVGHVAVRLADRLGVGRRPGPGDRRALRLGGRLCRLRAVRAAGHARRPRDG